jgi:hypothetical protein
VSGLTAGQNREEFNHIIFIDYAIHHLPSSVSDDVALPYAGPFFLSAMLSTKTFDIINIIYFVSWIHMKNQPNISHSKRK